MHRLFVAIRPPPAVRGQLLRLMEGVGAARWQDDDQLHLTLRFIGEIDSRTAEDVAAVLASVRQPGFQVALDGVGAFGSKGRVNALWAGVRPHDALAHLHRKVDHALVRIGLEPERRAFLPHITLARSGRGAKGVDAFLARHAGLRSPAFDVTWFALYESRLGQAAAAYTQVGTVYQLDPGVPCYPYPD